METNSIRLKVIEITEVFGMKASVASKAMRITESTFRKNKSEKSKTHNFNSKNLEDLISYIKQKSKAY